LTLYGAIIALAQSSLELVTVTLIFSKSQGPDSPSGFGFELTFRLKREPDETAPPTWPAALLQALARYVFQSGLFILLFSVLQFF
jgi:hypothetical protein